MAIIYYLLSLLLILTLEASLVYAQNDILIAETIMTLQASEPDILSLNPLLLTNSSYQAQAREAVIGVLVGGDSDLSPTEGQIRNFYVLACVYFATNGVANKFTDLYNPGCPVSTWTVDDWLWPPNYCEEENGWTGVTCDEFGKNIIAIELPANNLHGNFPPEIVLLKSTLQRLNVRNNDYHTSDDPMWLSRMGELEYLYFGSTSWEYPGVPIYLNGLRRIIELDMSNTQWIDGPIRRNAFAGLNYLEYLDMGDNKYDTSVDQSGDFDLTIPTLFSLKTLYLDRSEFTPNPLGLQFFLGGMPALEEAYFDFTNFNSSIPPELGLRTSLTTFSCSYCGLSGTLPTELGVLTSLQVIRLQANQLSGTVPIEVDGWSKLSTLLLEANDLLVSPLPDSICTFQNLTKLGVDCDIECSCCTCCGATCGNLVDPTPTPTGRPTFASLPTRPPTFQPTVSPTTVPPTDMPTASPTAAPVIIITDSPTEVPPTANTGPCRAFECALLCDDIFTSVLVCDTSGCDCGSQPQSQPSPRPTPRTTSAPVVVIPFCGNVDCAIVCDPTSTTAFACDNSTCTCPEKPATNNTVSFGCFSGDSTVEVKNMGQVRMRDLALGDLVQVSYNSYEPIYSFGHKNHKMEAVFLEIATSSQSILEISMDHMVVMKGNHIVPASTIQVGDVLLTASTVPVTVRNVRTVLRTGVYAPFTTSGFIIVNGIRASNYIAFQESEYLSLGKVGTPFSFQWLAHLFNSIHRVVVLAGHSKESYTAAGISRWVDLPHQAVRWLLEQHMLVCVSVLMPTIFILWLVSIGERLFMDPITVLIAGVALIIGTYLLGSRGTCTTTLSKK